jgi:hypothetical protein
MGDSISSDAIESDNSDRDRYRPECDSADAMPESSDDEADVVASKKGKK